jgi:hypothetical protein
LDDCDPGDWIEAITTHSQKAAHKIAKRNTLQSHSLEALMGTKTDKQGSEQEAFQALNQGIAALSLEESREKRLRAFLTRGQDGSLKDLVGLNKKENKTFSGEDIELF